MDRIESHRPHLPCPAPGRAWAADARPGPTLAASGLLVLRHVLVVVGLLWSAGLAGCIPPDRVNASCVWREGADALGAPGTYARRAHLTADARLAQELGVRYADAAVGRPPPVMNDWERAERQCTGAALDAAVRRHARDGVTRADLDALRGARDWWFDLLAVFVPAGVLFALASRGIARRVAAAGDGDFGVPTAVLAVLTPAVAGIALGVTLEWGWLAEMLRLRNNHISYRGGQLPTSRHPWLVAAVAAAVFAVAAVVEVRRMRRAARSAPRGRARAPVGSVSLGIGRRRAAPP